MAKKATKTAKAAKKTKAAAAETEATAASKVKGKVAKAKKVKATGKPSSGGAAKNAPSPTASALANVYRSALTKVDKEAGVSSGTGTQITPIHTGSLMQDFICGGGARPGLFVAQGMEASGKSTSCVHMTEQAARYNIPLRTYLDPEGAVGPDFVQHVITSSDPGSLFGEAVSYYQDNVIEDVCTHVAGIVDLFPEKDYIGELNSWVYKVPRGKDPAAVAMLDRLKQAGLKPDEKFSKGLDSLIIPTDYAGPEAFIALDSWASLVPRKAKENAKTKDLTGGDALAARVFGQYVPLFGGELKKRGVVMWTTNQLRTNPRQMFGDPLYAKSDGTLKFYYTCTNRMMPRAVPAGQSKDKETGALGSEPSVYGGIDRYAYKGVSNLKNKWGRPFLKGMLRIWVSDHAGHMRGIDPVWDTMEYLRMTGQQDGGNKKLKFMPRPSAPAGLKALAEKPVEYMDFKRLILAEHTGDKELLSTVLKKLKLSSPPKLREGLVTQMRKDDTLWAGSGRVESEQQEADDDE